MRLVEYYQKKRIDSDGISIAERYMLQNTDKRSSLSQPSEWFLQALAGGISNHSGKPVTDKTAMSIAAVHACVNVISNGLSSMPLKVYQTDGRNKNIDKTSKVARLIEEPNPFTTGVAFRKYMAAVAVLKGNSYAFIFRDASGNPTNLLPLQNCTVTPVISSTGLYYQISTNDALYANIPKMVSAYDMLHFKGLCINDQFTAISPIQYHAETLGMDLAAMASMSAQFKSGTKKYMITSEKPWSTEQQNATRDSMDKVLGNEKLVFTVPSGVAAQTISMTPQEAGYIDAMNMTAKDIARIFGVPASIIGADDGAIKASVEQDALNFLNQTLNPWAVGIEAELKTKLLTEKDKPTKYFKHNFNSLLRADAVSRAQYFTQMVNNGSMSPNEVRDLEDMNPYEGGDTYFVNANLVPTEQMPQWIQAKIDSMDKTNNPNGNN